MVAAEGTESVAKGRNRAARLDADNDGVHSSSEIDEISIGKSTLLPLRGADLRNTLLSSFEHKVFSRCTPLVAPGTLRRKLTWTWCYLSLKIWKDKSKGSP